MRIDEPEKTGGEGSGPRPSEAFVAPLARCFTLGVAGVGLLVASAAAVLLCCFIIVRPG